MPTKEKKHKRHAVDSVSWSQPKTPTEKTPGRIQRTDWIEFFQDSRNLFPNNLAEKARKASTHHSILASKHVYTCGDDLMYVDAAGEPYVPGTDTEFDEYIEKVNAKDESLYDVFCDAVKDYIYTANADLQAIRKKIGDTGNIRVNIEHMDTTNVRVGKKDKDGIIGFVYFSNDHDWREVRIKRWKKDQKQVTRLKVFKAGAREEKSVIHIKEYEPGFQYYGIPDYIGALISIEIEYRIPKFNLDRLDNGFMPSALVQLIGDPPDDMTPKQYIEKFVSSFTGEGKTSKVIVELIDDKEQAALIELFEAVKTGDFTELQKLTAENIISAHRWFPALAGLSIAGQLGSVQQILNEYEIAHATVIPAYRKAIIPSLNKLIAEAGFDKRISGVKNIMPISFLSSINFDKVVEKNEGREALGLEKKDKYDDQLIDDSNGAKITVR